MSLFRSSVRPPAVIGDEAVERYVAALRAHVDPDPDFRRRLRGVVLNQYVARREAGIPGTVPQVMGRLGRAVLYASFSLGVSVTGVMAASDVAVPGDVLYPLKRAIEDLRVEVLPDRYADALAMHGLHERLSELAVLIDRDDEARAELLAAEVATEYASAISAAADDDTPLNHRIALVGAALEQLPSGERDVIDPSSTPPSAFRGPARLSEGDGGPASGGKHPAILEPVESAADDAVDHGQDGDGGEGRDQPGGGTSDRPGGHPGESHGRENGSAAGNGQRESGADGHGNRRDEPAETPDPTQTPAPGRSSKP